MAAETALRRGIDASLASHNHANAIFLAERLCGFAPSDTNTLLLATCLFRDGQVKRAYHALKQRGGHTGAGALAGARFLLARCCVEMGELAEAERALAPPGGGGGTQPWVEIESAPELELLGSICRRAGRTKEAVQYFRHALRLDPLLWTAYQSLCELAADVDAAEVFRDTAAAAAATAMDGGAAGGPAPRQDASPNPSMALSFSGLGTTPGTGGRGGAGAGAGAAAAGDGGDPHGVAEAAEEVGQPQLMSCMRQLGAGYNHLCMYRCPEAVECFESLPAHQRQAGWVLVQLGRAHFEMVNYPEAEATFLALRRLDPMRLDGLEIHSTLLWHLRKEVELCALAQQAMELDRRAPQCLCVVGNCFALQKEHESALKFFLRAVQIEPQNPYAHTLAGHEHVANEEFDRGLDFFRAAILAEPRHYNAWYGLGYVYYRQEKYDLAEYHFRRALAINANSSVLWCYLGLVLAASKKWESSLEHLERALSIPPANALAQYKKATVLEKLGRHEEALEVLQTLRATAPKEPAVQLLLGKVYRKLGMECEAMHHYNEAVYLDPNKQDHVKAQQDRMGRAMGGAGLGDSDGDEEEDEIF